MLGRCWFWSLVTNMVDDGWKRERQRDKERPRCYYLRVHCSSSMLELIWMLSTQMCPRLPRSKKPSMTTLQIKEKRKRIKDYIQISAVLLLSVHPIFYQYINCHTWYSLGDWGRIVRPSLHMGPWSPFSTQRSVSSWSLSRSSTRRLSWPSPCSW